MANGDANLTSEAEGLIGMCLSNGHKAGFHLFDVCARSLDGLGSESTVHHQYIEMIEREEGKKSHLLSRFYVIMKKVIFRRIQRTNLCDEKSFPTIFQ